MAAETPRGQYWVMRVVQGTGYHPEIQQDIARRMRGGTEMPGLIALLIWGKGSPPILAPGAICGRNGAGQLTVIPQRLTAEQSGEMGRKMDAFKERVIRNSLRPLPCPVSDARRNTVAGCLTRPSDWLRISGITKGGVCPSGEVMNPLQYVPLTRRCISSMAMIRRRWPR